eukprot:238196_1
MAIISINPATVLSERIISSISLSHNIALFIYVVCYHHRHKQETGVTSDLALPLYFATIMVFVAYLSFNIICTLSTLVEFFDDSIFNLNCFIWYIMIFISYYFSKLFIWQYSIIRLRLAFKNTASLGYSKRFLCSLSWTFNAVVVGLVIFCLLTVNAFWTRTTSPVYCAFNASYWFYMVYGAAESILSVLCYYLFYRKLNALLSLVQNVMHMRQATTTDGKGDTDARSFQNYELIYLLRKYAILSGTAILSTWICAGLAMMTESGMGIYCFDSMINCWCIVLFDARYDCIYLKVFGCIAKKDWNNQKNQNGGPGSKTGSDGLSDNPKISIE